MKTITQRQIIAAVLAAFTLGAGAHLAAGEGDKNREATVSFVNGEGQSVGSAKLTETAHGVLIDAELKGLEPGWHGFHVHEHGKCERPDFKSAGGHYAPEGASHGFKVKDGPHAGDLENIHVGDNGEARVHALAGGVTLRDGKNALFDKDGSAIVVHSKPDDYQSQPSGDAGNRIACAEITPR